MLLLLIAFTLLLGYYIYRFYFSSNGRNLPPGPRGIPILGYIPFMRPDAYRQFHEMTKKYGKMFALNIGPKYVLILNDWKSVKESILDQGEIFAGRTPTFMFQQVVRDKDVITADGPITKMQRRFSLAVLRDFGVGKVGAEIIVAEEVEQMINELNGKSGQVMTTNDLFFIPFLNITWYIIAGERYQYDKRMREFQEAIKFNMAAYNNTQLFNFYPFLRFFDPTKSFKKFMKNHEQLWAFIQECVRNHEETFVLGNENRDFIDAYLTEIFKRKEEKTSGEDTHPFTAFRLMATLYNLLHAGIETTANTLHFGILYMALWPEIQTKVQKEIDRVIGNSRFTVYSDKNQLPYTEAVILEMQRCASTAPLSIPHRVTTDTTVGGYNIPKDTVVFPNIWAVHHDPDTWGDPEVFRPERFLDENNQVKKPEYLIPFSVGPRYCIGERLARLSMFLFFTSIFQRFTAKLPVGRPPPTLKELVGLTLSPEPFDVIFECR